MTVRERQANEVQGASSRVLVLDVPIADPRHLRRMASKALAEIEVLEDLGYEVRGLGIEGYLVRDGF